jgi:hypothetical protein
MNDPGEAPANPETQPGIMSSLPKTRPQRPSARRATARAEPKKTAKRSPAKSPRKRSPAKAEPLRAPRQGFEAQSESEVSKPVAPPSGVELAASVVEMLGELAQSGLRSGERLLRDALKRPGA